MSDHAKAPQHALKVCQRTTSCGMERFVERCLFHLTVWGASAVTSIDMLGRSVVVRAGFLATGLPLTRALRRIGWTIGDHSIIKNHLARKSFEIRE